MQQGNQSFCQVSTNVPLSYEMGFLHAVQFPKYMSNFG